MCDLVALEAVGSNPVGLAIREQGLEIVYLKPLLFAT